MCYFISDNKVRFILSNNEVGPHDSRFDQSSFTNDSFLSALE